VVTTGSDPAVAQFPPSPRAPAIETAATAATLDFARSACEPHCEWIEQQFRLKRNAQAMYEYLVNQFGFTAIRCAHGAMICEWSNWPAMRLTGPAAEVRCLAGADIRTSA